jgi:voltage-gated potassium channel
VDARSSRVERAFATPTLIAAIVVVPLVGLENAELGGAWPTVLAVVNWMTWAVFAAEAVAMLAVVPKRGVWLREHPLEVAIVLLTFPAASAVLPAIRVLRALRLLRLVRLAKLSRVVFSVSGLKYAALLALLVALGGGEAFSAIEKASLGEGVYWAVTTMTTVGYGDLSPETDAGKVLAVGVMLCGIGFVAVLTGAVAERFLAQDVGPIAGQVEALADAEALEVTRERALAGELREVRRLLATIEARLASEGPTADGGRGDEAPAPGWP